MTKNKTKKQSKSKSKIPKIVGEKRNFSPFRTGSKIADLLGHLTITYKEESFQCD